MYARAKEGQYESWASEVLTIAHSKPVTYIDKHGAARIDPAWTQLIKIQIDSRKWLLSKLCRSKYGDKIPEEKIDSLLNQIFRVDTDGNPIE